MLDPASIAAPALLAGGIAIGATMAIERWGGVAGGLLATLPTTVVPASWAFWAVTEADALRDALGAVPVGMLANAGFLYVWRVLPSHVPGSFGARLTTMIAVSLGCWVAMAAAAVGSLEAARARGVDVWAVGALAMLITVVFGGWAVAQQVPAPRGGAKVPWWSLVARGGLAALAIATAAVLAAVGGELLAALASVFPAIFLTAMVSLWWAQGEAVPSGAVGPMMLGSASVSGYALLAAWTLPSLGPLLGAAVAWVLAVGLVTVPAWAWARRVGRRQKA